MAISVASALVSSCLDQVNSILYGAASKHIDRLQRVRKALARIVMHQRSHCSPLSATALLQNLHWLLGPSANLFLRESIDLLLP